ncbi:hypothetical protein D3C85_1766910 [compost metagenome]
MHGERFFRKDADDTQCHHAQYGTRHALVMQQPCCDCRQDDNTDNRSQQFADMNRFEIGF